MPQINLKLDKRLFNDVYYPYLFDYTHRHEIYYGSAGSGKSVFVAQKLVVKALTKKRKILVVRKVMATQKDSCWQLIIDTLSRFKVSSLCQINKSTFTIELVNGSIFLFKGMDEREKIKSIVGITDIWCEEATELQVEDIEQLDLRLRARESDLQFIYSFNPVSKANYTYKRWFERPLDDDTFVLKTTYKDNKFLPQSYIDALEKMKQTNYTYYCIYALGEFCSLDKLIFSNWRQEDVDYPKDLPIIIGLDFGYAADPSALIVSRIDEENKVIYVVDEYYKRAMLNNEIADMIKYKGYSKEVIIADSAEQKSIAEIKNTGILRIKAAVKGQGSVLQGIQKLQQYELVVSSNCPNLIVELQNYSWKKNKDGEYINEPQDCFNHAIDALRYSLQCVENKRRMKVMNKAMLSI